MSSTRLPGKVLLPIAGKPMLKWVIDAAVESKLIDKVIVATAAEKDNMAINDLCHSFSIDLFVGSLDDVLDRFYQAATMIHPSHIVRLTGDCPMLNAQVIDDTVKHHLKGGYDYTCNFVTSYISSDNTADGLDVEVFTYDTLLRAAKLATNQHDREHVTPFMSRYPSRVGHYLGYPMPNRKMSVDTQEDYERVKGEME